MQILKKLFYKVKTTQAKVCMTLGRKTTYCHEIWTHMKLAR